MKKILRYLNPIAHLGEKHYSIWFPLITSILAAVILEYVSYRILGDPNAVGLAAIFVFIALIIYFAFREGIRGGITAAVITIAYYLYIIDTRNYTGEQLNTGLETTAVLGGLYIFIAWVIGWLKQKIDTLIEREANEKRRLSTIIQQLPVGVVVADAEGKFMLGNKQIEIILGRKIRTEGIAGRDTIMNATLSGKRIAPSQWPLAQAIATGKTVTGKDIIIDQERGKRMHVQVSAAPIHDRKGNIIAAASIFNDITIQKELEERKDDFVNMASHELKTPITSMKLYGDTLMSRIKKSGDKDMIKMMRGISNQTEKLQSLVNDLLDVSRLQTGKMTFTYEEFRLDELVKETLESLRRTTKQSVIYTGKTPITVTADRFRIYQVITNFITNAAKYSPEDSDITVRVKKEKGNAVLSVKDHGIGIPEDQQKKIFGRLYQVVDSKEKSFPGLGMGLYIAKEIIKKHKGNIWVESTEGKGSTFYFSLPLKR